MRVRYSSRWTDITAGLLVMESNVLTVYPLAPRNLFSGTDSTPGFAIKAAFTVFIVGFLVMGAYVLAVDLLADLGAILSHFLVFLVTTINPFLRTGLTPGFAVFTARLLMIESNVLAEDPLAPLNLFSGTDSTPRFAIIAAFTFHSFHS